MPDRLFSDDLRQYTALSQQTVREFVSAIACDVLVDASESYVGALCADRHIIEEPSLDSEPTSRDLEDDGKTAVYAHKVSNASALVYKPSSYQFGGWPCRIMLKGDLLFIRLDASSNPPPKIRHADIVNQLQTNIAVLAQDIVRHNAQVRAIIPGLIEERRKRCNDLAALRDSL